MNFSKAMDLLKLGNKVTRQSWVGSIYFQLVNDHVKSFQPIKQHYNYEEDIMISDGWIVEGEEKTMSFADAIPFLQQGKKARQESWDKDTYIIYDWTSKSLISSSMQEFAYQVDFASFTAEDWLVVD